MSLAVYAKLWASTAQFQQRRHYAWYQVGSRVGMWAIPACAWFSWLLFPALPEEYRTAITFGIWKKPDILRPPPQQHHGMNAAVAKEVAVVQHHQQQEELAACSKKETLRVVLQLVRFDY